MHCPLNVKKSSKSCIRIDNNYGYYSFPKLLYDLNKKRVFLFFPNSRQDKSTLLQSAM
jgi:hypothetical protein